MSSLNTLTNTYLLPKITDTVLRENPLTEKILTEPEKWRGEQIKKSIKVVKNTNGTSFAGFQTGRAVAGAGADKSRRGCGG